MITSYLSTAALATLLLRTAEEAAIILAALGVVTCFGVAAAAVCFSQELASCISSLVL